MHEDTSECKQTTRDHCGLAIASLVLGILSLMTCGPLAGIPAVICGNMAVAQIKKSSGMLGGNGLATAGIILGYISIVATVLLALVAALCAFLNARMQCFT